MAGYQIAAYMQPAEQVGGDYYDVINAEGRDWLVIGDVSGHGVPAGLIMMMAQTAIHTAVRQNPDLAPSRLLSVINSTITSNMRQLGEDKYMTITALATYRNGEFDFSGLHQDIMVYRADEKAVDLIETTGIWLGLEKDISDRMKDNSFRIKIGDVILIYTDGITEAWRKGSIPDRRNPDADMFGMEYLKNIFRGLGSKHPDVIRGGIIQALVDYQPRDDVTLVVVKRVE
jgi:histidine kinase